MRTCDGPVGAADPPLPVAAASVTLAGMTPTQRKPATSTPATDKPKTEDVEVTGTGPDGEWRPETHGESPADRPKSEF